MSRVNQNSDINKSQVALRFAQAGQSYTEHAIVQKQIAQHLFALIGEYCPDLFKNQFSNQCLDPLLNIFEIGCGSGNLSHLLLENLQFKRLILNDLYAEIQQHFQTNLNLEYLIGDIEQLEFPKSLDLIASSSALQWVSNLEAIFKKAFLALNPQAYFCFSTFGQQNLQEIKALTGQGLDYLSVENIQHLLEKNGFEILHISEQIAHLNFQHPKQVLQHLKATGVTSTASNFRWTKQTLADFYQDYQQFSLSDEFGQTQYPLTYHPIYCIARRTP